MYPAALHFIRYKRSYLGAPAQNRVFAFVKASHANNLRAYIKYENMDVGSPTPYVYTLSPPPKRRPLNRKNLVVETMDTATGLFFAQVNNTEVALIDEVSQKNDQVELHSNYNIDFDILDDALYSHLERLYDKHSLETIDYGEELSNMLVMAATQVPIGYDLDETTDEEED